MEYLRSLAESRVFFAPQSSRPLGGLAIVDAVAAGCIPLVSRCDMWNPVLAPTLNKPTHLYYYFRMLTEMVASENIEMNQFDAELRLSKFVASRANQQLLKGL